MIPMLKQSYQPAYAGAAFFALATAVLPTSTARGQETQDLRPVDVEKADQLRQDLRQMITLARDRVFPALINIRVITVRYWGGKEHKGAAGGSGTIIS